VYVDILLKTITFAETIDADNGGEKKDLEV